MRYRLVSIVGGEIAPLVATGDHLDAHAHAHAHAPRSPTSSAISRRPGSSATPELPRFVRRVDRGYRPASRQRTLEARALETSFARAAVIADSTIWAWSAGFFQRSWTSAESVSTGSK